MRRRNDEIIDADNGPVPYETIRFDDPPKVNPLPVLTFECAAGRPLPHSNCRGRTYWGGACSCHCHLPATSLRAQVE